MAGDTLSVEGDDQKGEPLIRPVMQAGKRVAHRRHSWRSEHMRHVSFSFCPRHCAS